MERPSKKLRVEGNAPGGARQAHSIIFFHPDLGIGGAERLIIDAAVGLQKLGHKITIFTSHCDPNHCFDEARDGTLDVRVRGNRVFPATIFGRFKILFSILRQIHLLCSITWTGELRELKPNAFFIDQLSAGIPFLRWFYEDIRILFYCHFPDLLLVQGRKSWYKRIWRIPFDLIEGWGMRGADRIVVNSGFTKGVVERIWPFLQGKEREVKVVYPCVDTMKSNDASDHAAAHNNEKDMWKDKTTVLSINRFEPKKNIGLAIKAFAGLRRSDREGVRLVLAGGYDTRIPENVSYLKDLELLAASLKLKTATVKNIVTAQAIPSDIEVLFLLSVPDQLKSLLLKAAKLLLYTPSDEHFGIVPLEAMLAGVPVLASNTGGPLETVIDGVTGWLRPVEHPHLWTDVVYQVLRKIPQAQLTRMGENGREHVKEDFSRAKMAESFDHEIDDMMKARRPQSTELGDVGVAIILYFAALGAIAFVLREATRTDIPVVPNTLTHVALGVALIVVAISVVVLATWKLRQHESAFM